MACLFRLGAGPNGHAGAGSIRAACHDSRIVLLVCLLRKKLPAAPLGKNSQWTSMVFEALDRPVNESLFGCLPCVQDVVAGGKMEMRAVAACGCR